MMKTLLILLVFFCGVGQGSEPSSDLGGMRRRLDFLDKHYYSRHKFCAPFTGEKAYRGMNCKNDLRDLAMERDKLTAFICTAEKKDDPSWLQKKKAHLREKENAYKAMGCNDTWGPVPENVNATLHKECFLMGYDLNRTKFSIDEEISFQRKKANNDVLFKSIASLSDFYGNGT
ncbi:MAG: hypothetical protein K2X98_06740 [Alphaproteobacteria bacterium]|nr:hypothetical protein [Alphaproteobacteria bacterium]